MIYGGVWGGIFEKVYIKNIKSIFELDLRGRIRGQDKKIWTGEAEQIWVRREAYL